MGGWLYDIVSFLPKDCFKQFDGYFKTTIQPKKIKEFVANNGVKAYV